MKNEFEMITVVDFINQMDNIEVVSLAEFELENEIAKHLETKRNYKFNTRLLEAV